MKQRFSSLDVKVIAHELSASLVSLRLSNIYDLSSKIFLLKFALPDNKKQMVIDSGFRCHLTSFTRATAAAPSIFVTKLRKYLKTRRCTKVSQVGTDRILEFQFSDGQYRLYLEFFAAGNIILTDKDLNILTLLRVVPPGEGQEEQRVGLQYSLENRQNYLGIPPLTKERVKAALEKAAEKEAAAPDVQKKQKKKGNDALRKALAVSISEYPPMLVDHAMRVTGFDASLKPAEVAANDELLDQLLKSLAEAGRVIEEITSKDVATGYIIAKKGREREADPTLGQEEKEEQARQNLLYEDFHPFKPKQFEDDPECIFLPFEGFNTTVDEFFSSIEGQKLESRLHERELNAKKKLEAAKQDQQKRLGGLKDVQTLNERKAAAIQANVERVQEAMDAVNGLVAQGIDWHEIGLVIEMEQKRGNPVASMIKLPLKLQENTVTLMLDEETLDDDEDGDYDTGSEASESESEDEGEQQKPTPLKDDKRLTIDINLGMTPWANAREYFDSRKQAIEKEKKTLVSAQKALKSTAQKIEHDLKKGLNKEKEVLRPIRKIMWFEKFIWFISSDGYLVIGGKDAQQNETLYKKYLRKGDVYVHADMHGAPSIVIRNKFANTDAPMPPTTLSQAGTLAVSASSAWDSKAGMGAWWVNADQVSKSAPTGEFLPTGSFMVKGKKNFLPPAQLVLGFGVMWMVSEESKKNHSKHRVEGGATDGGAETPVSEGEKQLVEESEEERNASDDVDQEEYQPAQTDTTQEQDDDEQDDASPSTEADSGEIVGTTSKLAGLDISYPEAAEEPTPEAAEEDQEDQEASHQRKGKGPAQPQAPKSKGPAPLPRGKRSKAKKAAQKYALQDEEDRLAAQSLIGVSSGKAKATAEAEAKAAAEREAQFQRQRRKQQHLRTQEEVAKTEAKRQAMLQGAAAGGDEGEDQEGEVEDEYKILENLVGTPAPGDEIVAAVAVCAPWAALARLKYKVKLQPGTTKKGRAVKEILGRWQAEIKPAHVDEEARDREKVWPRELELIRGLRAEEVNGVVPTGKVRVVLSGGEASKGKGGAAKNGGKKGGRGRGSKKMKD